jgi:acetyl-CoA C-acetyltransferase
MPSSSHRPYIRGHDCQHAFRELGHISREAQDAWALKSHQRAVAGWDSGFFDDLIIKLPELERDSNPRADTSAEKLAALKPAFDKTSGEGTLTAGNSSPMTDGAAGCWIANEAGIARLPANTPYLRLVDYEMAAVDHHTEGLLMAPPYAIPRLLARHGLRFDDIDLWEIHLMCDRAATRSRSNP